MQPATLRHPETGLETLQLYAFSHGQTHLALEGYRLARAERPELPQVERILYAGPDHNGLALVAAHGELLPLSEPESIDIFRAIFCAARVHPYPYPYPSPYPYRYRYPYPGAHVAEGRRAPLRQHTIRPRPTARPAG